MTYRVRNILIAVALAVVAGLLTLFYVTSYKKHVDSQQKSVSVLVAKDDIPAGTLGSQVLAKHMLTTVHVSRGEGDRARRRQRCPHSAGDRQPVAEAGARLQEGRLLGRRAPAEHQRRRQPGKRRDPVDAAVGRHRPQQDLAGTGRWSVMSDTHKSNIRVFAIGSCDGFPEILRALESHDEVELVGARETVA